MVTISTYTNTNGDDWGMVNMALFYSHYQVFLVESLVYSLFIPMFILLGLSTYDFPKGFFHLFSQMMLWKKSRIQWYNTSGAIKLFISTLAIMIAILYIAIFY